MAVKSSEQPVLRSLTKEDIAFFALACLAAAIFVLLYWETFSEIAVMWGTYQGAHGPVILAISLYMIWIKRELLKQIPPAPLYLSGIAVTIFGCFLLAAGRVGSVLLLQYLSMVVSLWGLILLIGGGKYFGILWCPVGYLIFMFPIFSEILDAFSIYLQTAAAWMASTIMSLAGVEVYRHGHLLDLPTITLDVARECNGVNHIMALVSLAIPLAYWTQPTWMKRGILIGLAFPIGVIANGLRVSIIGIYAYYLPGGPAHGPYDLFYVSFIFFFGTGALVVLSQVLCGKEICGHESKLSEPSASRSLQSLLKRGVAFAVASGILLSTWLYLVTFNPEVVALAQPIETFPYEVSKWKGQDLVVKGSVFGEFLADIELQRLYSDGEGGQFRIYIGYFPVQGQDKEVVHYRFDSLQANAVPLSLKVNGSVIGIKMTIEKEESSGRTACFWYVIHNEVVTNRYGAKIATILDGLLYQRTNAAIVVIEFEKDGLGDPDIEAVEKFFPVIMTQLTKTGDAI